MWAGRAGDAWHKLTGPRDGPRVLVTSIPKSGTHLIVSALSRFPGVRVCPELILGNVSIDRQIRRITRLGASQVLVGHIAYDERVASALTKADVKLVLMLRDPRDIVVSRAKYITRPHAGHRLHRYFTEVLTTDEGRVMACIRGVPAEHSGDGRALGDIDTLFRSFLVWAKRHQTHLCRFEDLVGSQGGGSDPAQLEALKRLVEFLGVGIAQPEVESIARATFSKDSLTFRKGKIGDWRQHFTAEHKAAFLKHAGDLLIELGYEKDRSW